MKLKELKEYINNMPKELDDYEVYMSVKDMEKGRMLEPVKSLKVKDVKTETKTFVDAFDGTVYNDTITKIAFYEKDKGNKALLISYYK